ncbi:YeeE/YedE family protein [uncultured Marinobacter sp.]|uniref:YeeE/YedE family protein n=1 Tax=uncultured Marinobacter sp. TaxID=187379 RepID=UPI0025976106|nr:YeeE/YedE family protein [uncultured Marinobacter sp.]
MILRGASLPLAQPSRFTPGAALTGGILIGLAVASFLLLNGRIAGISGILGGLLAPVRTDILWRVAFLAGLIGAPAVWALFAQLPPVEINADYPALIVAGLLVGIGTRYASGCTSGHGVCGLSRLSLRSLVATLSFMATGFITVFVIRHLIGA